MTKGAPHHPDIWQTVAAQRASGAAGVVVTVAALRGSTPTEVGAKMLVTREGLAEGTVGGGKVEAAALAQSATMLTASRPHSQLRTWNLQQDIGMTCGGEISLLFEPFGHELAWHIVIFGAGHVAQKLVPLLSTLSCQIEVVDERQEWLDALPTSPNVKTHLVAEFKDGCEWVGEGTFVLMMTKGHAFDRPVIAELLRREYQFPYLGVIGSASKRAVLLRELGEDGISEERRQTLICPIGLPLGTNSPPEIAVSVAAQLLAVRDSLTREAE